MIWEPKKIKSVTYLQLFLLEPDRVLRGTFSRPLPGGEILLPLWSWPVASGFSTSGLYVVTWHPPPRAPHLKPCSQYPAGTEAESGRLHTTFLIPVTLQVLAGPDWSEMWVLLLLSFSQLFPALAGVSLWGQLASYPACPSAFLLSKFCGCCLFSSCYGLCLFKKHLITILLMRVSEKSNWMCALILLS